MPATASLAPVLPSGPPGTSIWCRISGFCWAAKPVSHEEVYVERRPGSGQPTDQPIGESETYRVPVREEVSIGTRRVQNSQRVSDTVRREEAHIERQGDINVEGT